MDKEEEINKRIEMLKRKNERLMQRHKEVEADKKSAEKSGQSFNEKAQHTEPQRSLHSKRSDKVNRSQPRAHMDEVEDNYPEANTNNRNSTHSFRGRGSTNLVRGTSRGRGRGSRRFQDYEAKRLENYKLMEEEMAQNQSENDDGVSRFLDDPRRRGELEPDERWKTTRHKGNYGGTEFDNVKRGIRGRGRGGHREAYGRDRGVSRLQTSAEYTGRERQDQERWLAMRTAADREIMARSKNEQGKWRREWDAEKDGEFDRQIRHNYGQSDQRGEARRNYRGSGRGRRRSEKSRLGSKSSHESGENGKKDNKESEIEPPPEKGDASTGPAKEGDSDCKAPDVEEESQKKEPKTQRPKKNQAKSPRHLVQQRAQTPSSKDGTEVWAQNSHHSDETGAEWKNGASRSTEQWLPSNEGNRNPAIDERMLEQQEDGATVYSRQLGRGWGTEKNIKATKAWVIDTEKAGAAKHQTAPEKSKRRGRDDSRYFGKTHAGQKNLKGDSRVKEVLNERTEVRSASPRLKRDHPGLTIEIHKGGSRRVKRHSEGDHSSQNKDDKGSGKRETANSENDDKPSSPSTVRSPVSAGVLKTPEGMEYVEDWATEMDLQSPTYASRQQKMREVASQQLQTEFDRSETNKPEVVAAEQEKMQPEDEPSQNLVSASEVVVESKVDDSNDLGEYTSEEGKATTEETTTVLTKTQVQPPEISTFVTDNETGAAGDVSHSPEKQSPAPGKMNEEINESNKDAMDGKYKDANEDVEDEFYECDDNKENTMQAESSDLMNVAVRAESVQNGKCSPLKVTEIPAATVTLESIQTVAGEVVQQQPISPPSTEGAESSTFSKTEADGESENPVISEGDALNETSSLVAV